MRASSQASDLCMCAWISCRVSDFDRNVAMLCECLRRVTKAPRWSRTMRPKTLLQMAGASTSPSRLADAAVVVIDAQREYVDGRMPLAGVQPALGEIARLIAQARHEGAPIVHIVHEGKAGGAFDRAASGGQIADPAAPAAGEIVIAKRLPNAFAGTDLAAQLE